MRKSGLEILVMLALTHLWSVPFLAQQGGHGIDAALLKDCIVAGRVVNLQGRPVHGATVRIQAAGGWRDLVTDFQGEFHAEYSLTEITLQDFPVELTVTMKGFLQAHRMLDFETTSGDFPAVQVTLRDANQNPDLLAPADLISGLAPKLKDLGTADGLSAKSEKDYARGAQEFLERKRVDRALPFFIKTAKHEATCGPCRTMLGLAELASSDWDGAANAFAEAAEQGRKDAKQARPEPLLALGVMESWRGQPERAAGFLEEALRYAPDHPLALQEIGRAEVQLRNWTAANDHLAKAVAVGGSPEARLLHVQALLGADKPEEANQEMARFLGGQDVRTMPVRVRTLWAQVQNQKRVEAAYAQVKTRVEAPLDYLSRAMPELQGLEPAEDQKPLQPILAAVGTNVEEFFRSFPNTSSLEKIHQEKVKGNGKRGENQDQKFQYLCVTPVNAWGPGFSEYRASLSGDPARPRGLTEGFMITSGFASASLVFHPAYQSEAAFRYLGRQKVNGRATHVLLFAQHPSQAHVYGSFMDGKSETAIYVQGVAWVDCQNYQILRLLTDLLKPLPEIELRRQTTDIDFSEVHFKSIPGAFWLPHEVAVTVDWRGRVLRNDHQYSDFKVFNVDSKEKMGKPKDVARSAKEASDSPEN